MSSVVSQLSDGSSDHLDKSYCIVPHKFNSGETGLRQRYQGTCVEGDSSFQNYDVLKQCMVRFFDTFEPIYQASLDLKTKQDDFVQSYSSKFEVPAVEGMESWKEEQQERVKVSGSEGNYRPKLGLDCSAVNPYLESLVG